MDYKMLPGGELVEAGLRDLALGVESVAVLLVAVGAPRLRALGVAVPPHAFASPEHRLYEKLRQEGEDDAHSRYNALVRRLVSFERAAECVKEPTRTASGLSERGHAQDTRDVREMLQRGLVEQGELRRHFDAVAPRLYRYPALDPSSFRRKLEAALAEG